MAISDNNSIPTGSTSPRPRPPVDDNSAHIDDSNYIKDIIGGTIFPTPIKPWYASREDVPILGYCVYDITASGNSLLPGVGISCTCDSDTMLDGDMSNGEYAPLVFEAAQLKSFGSSGNGNNECCSPSLYDWYNTMASEGHIPCNAPVEGNSNCDYISTSGVKTIDPYGEEFYITLSANSAFTGHINCGSQNSMWITRWCVGDYSSTDCIDILEDVNTNKMKIADVCPPPCENPSECSDITIWFDSSANYRDDNRQCNFEIHSYYNWEDETDDISDRNSRGNRGNYLSVPLIQEGGAEKVTQVPEEPECPPHIACPPGQYFSGWPQCECVSLQPLYSCQDNEACNYSPIGINPCEDCCLYPCVVPGGCPPEYADPLYDCNGNLIDGGSGETILIGCFDDSACNTTDCPPDTTCENDPTYCIFSTEYCDCDGQPYDEFCNCDGSVYDECGVCNGDNSTCTDQCGVPNGDNSSCADECGVPNGDNSTCSDECGVPNGDNSTCLDECGVPNGNGIPDGNCDCLGNVVDECGVCNGDNSTCSDCAGVPNGTSIQYTCGNGTASDFPCGGGPHCSPLVSDNCTGIPAGECDCLGTLPSGCDNECGSSAIVDECGVCGGDDSSCEDCAGVPNGDASLDCAGVCQGTSIQDCAGECYDPENDEDPTVIEDCAGVCDGESYVDCAGECDGGAFDCNGVCVDSDTICGCTDSTALNYDDTATADNGSCYFLDCTDFTTCDQYCVDGSLYCTSPDEIDTFCYTNNEFPAIYIRAGDYQYVSFTIPIIDTQDSYSLSDVMNNSLYDSNPDEGAASLQPWAPSTGIYASLNFDVDDAIQGYAELSETTGTWLGNLTVLDVSAGYYIYSYESGWLKWTLPV